jgi:hypothetical protein
MAKYEGEAQEQLRQIARELRSVHYRLLGIVATLPAPADEEPAPVEDEDADADVATEIRSAVECVLADRIRPAIQGLLAAAEYGSEEIEEIKEEDRAIAAGKDR